jgi:hypothetical protein
MKTPVLVRQPQGCPVCGSLKATYGVSRHWSRHKIGPGYGNGVNYGNEAAKPHCPASGKSRSEVDDLFRTFEDAANEGLKDFGRYAYVQDNGDSVILRNELGLAGEHSITIDVIVRPEDTLRLVTELTAIAATRGLVPDPAAVVREAVAAELRALAKSFGDEAHRRNEIGDDDGGCSCADDDLSCHTTEAVACYAHAQSRLNRRAAELNPPPALG